MNGWSLAEALKAASADVQVSSGSCIPLLSSSSRGVGRHGGARAKTIGDQFYSLTGGPQTTSARIRQLDRLAGAIATIMRLARLRGAT
jgi:hypothetical protein